jgi:type IV pilus assembly protein PilB
MQGVSMSGGGSREQDEGDDAVICEEIGRVLVAAGAVTASTMLKVLTLHEPDPLRCATELITHHHLRRETWTAAMSKVTGLAVVRPDELTSPLLLAEDFHQVLEDCGINRRWALRYRSVPLRRDGDTWVMMTAEARAVQRTQAQGLLGLKLAWVVSDPLTVSAMIDQLWRNDRKVADLISQLQTGSHLEVVELVDAVIAQAARDRASDLHIEPGPEQCRIRVRVDGRLTDLVRFPTSAHAAIVSRLKVMAQMDIVERRLPQDGTCAVEVDGQHLDVRVASLPTVQGEKIVLRLLPAEMAITSLEDLGMDSVTLGRYRQVLAAHDGVILCAGPTGAGKTTSLFASLAAINHPTRNLITIEDPVEYMLAGVTQVQTNHRAGLGFANGLRALLRQDPDVVLVGEIRDHETAAIAMQAALTGHLVLSSVHGTDAATGLYRLIDMGIAPYLVASALRAVIAQRLMRLNCSGCTRSKPIERFEADLMLAHGCEELPDAVWAGEGCVECLGTGYRGRVGVYELMVVSPALRELILAGATAGHIRDQAIAEQMITMTSAAMALVRSGRSSIKEVAELFHLLGPSHLTAGEQINGS